MTSSRHDGEPARPVYTGPVIDGRGAGGLFASAGAPVWGSTSEGATGFDDATGLGDDRSGGLAAAAARGRQVLELLAGAVRGIAAALRVSALAGLLAAVVITAIAQAAFDLRWWPALILFVVLALPAVEVAGHRLALLRTWGDAGRLERRVRDVSGAVVGGGLGAAGDFAERMAALRTPGSRGRQGFGAVRSAQGLRDVAGAVPGLAGVLFLPLRRQVLALTAACTAICWILLVLGVPVVIVVGLIGALAR